MRIQVTPDKIKGKEVLITGGAKRVGADIARYLAACGCNLIIHYYSSRGEAEALKNEIEEEYAVKVVLVSADLSKEADVKAIFAIHSPDVVVNNAARFEVGNYQSNSDANTTSSFLVSQEAIRRMVADKKRGVIFLVGDAFLERGGVYPGDLSGYALSKGGISKLVSALAAAHGKSGIRVNAIFNGPIEPPPTAKPEAIASIKAEINLPDEDLHPWIGGKAVGEAIVQFFGVRALNGAPIFLDGGRQWRAPVEH